MVRYKGHIRCIDCTLLLHQSKIDRAIFLTIILANNRATKQWQIHTHIYIYMYTNTFQLKLYMSLWQTKASSLVGFTRYLHPKVPCPDRSRMASFIHLAAGMSDGETVGPQVSHPPAGQPRLSHTKRGSYVPQEKASPDTKWDICCFLIGQSKSHRQI